MSSPKKLPINKIVASPDTQCRETIDAEVVSEYADAIKAGQTFAPIVVYHDGERYWLADGFHRHAAHAAAGLKKIDAIIHQGSKRDAILASAGANSQHGLRRSNADKRRAVTMLLDDPEWSKWSNREIARRCGVSNFLVDSLRSESPQKVPLNGTFSTDESRLYRTKHGKIAEMTVSKRTTFSEGDTVPQTSVDADESYIEEMPGSDYCEERREYFDRDGNRMIEFEQCPVGWSMDLIEHRVVQEGLPAEKLLEVIGMETDEIHTMVLDFYRAIHSEMSWSDFFWFHFNWKPNSASQPALEPATALAPEPRRLDIWSRIISVLLNLQYTAEAELGAKAAGFVEALKQPLRYAETAEAESREEKSDGSSD